MKNILIALFVTLGLGFSTVSLADTSTKNTSNKSSKVEKKHQKADKKDAKKTAKKDKQDKKDKQTKKDVKKTSKSKDAKKTPITKKKALTHKVNINTANLEELQALPGIGATKAKQILDYRKKHGSFKSIEEIMSVKGIGKKTFEGLKSNLSLR